VIRSPLQRSARSIERSSTSAWVVCRLPWLPAVLAAGFVVWTVSRFSRILDLVHLNPDSGFAPVLVSDMAKGNKGGIVFVGEASHLSAIGFLYLTRHFPLREVIWDWAPYLTFLAALGVMAWACWQVAGPWAAAMTVAVGACAEATVLLTVMAEGMRGNTFFADAAVCAYLVLMLRRPALARPAKVAATSAVVAIAGSTVASDPLFLVAGLAPMVGAAAVVWLLVRDRRSGMLALLTLGIGGAALGVSTVIWAVARSAGFRKNYLEGGYALPDGEQMATNVRLFWRHVRTLTQSSVHTPLAVLVIAVAIYACVLLVQLGRRAGDAEDPGRPALVAYTAFWLLSAMAILAAFALSSFAAGPSDTSRYVIPVFLALAAVGPLWGRRADWRRPLAAAGVAAYCIVSISARGGLFVEGYPGLGGFRDSGAEAVAFLESEGLTHGYSGYFTSHPLTLLSDERLHSYPWWPATRRRRTRRARSSSTSARPGTCRGRASGPSSSTTVTGVATSSRHPPPRSAAPRRPASSAH